MFVLVWGIIMIFLFEREGEGVLTNSEFPHQKKGDFVDFFARRRIPLSVRRCQGGKTTSTKKSLSCPQGQLLN